MPYAIRLTEFRNNVPHYTYWNPTTRQFHTELGDEVVFIDRIDAWHDLHHHVPVWNFRGEGHERTRFELVQLWYDGTTWSDPRPESDIPRVRFWTFVNGGAVKLSLGKDESLAYWRGGPTDEGRLSVWTTWWFDGTDLHRRIERTETDCDGRVSNESHDTVPAEEVTHHPIDGNDHPTPDWRNTYRQNRDYTAEAAGY
jgi:hypothetical protein